MKYINYKDYPEIRKDIEPLYVSAFPEEERPPVEIFFQTVKLDNDDLYGFYEGNEFIGFANVILYKDIVYLFFLAIAPEKRNKGYGSIILSVLKEMFKDNVLTLCYEEIDEKYLDIELRKRRKSFYYRNGFINNKMKTCEYGVNYETCYIGSHRVSFIDYLGLYQSVFGERVKKIIKEIK